MRKVFHLQIPAKEKELLRLRAGDKAYLCGALFTARDQAHKRLVDVFKRGKRPPFELKDSFIYYTGAAPSPPGRVMGSCGPTTSSRMDIFTPLLLRKGVKGLIGKGDRSNDVIAALKKYKAVYFVALGGAAALVADRVTEKRLVAYPELGTEAIYRLVVEDFPVFVGVDSRGGNIYPVRDTTEAGKKEISNGVYPVRSPHPSCGSHLRRLTSNGVYKHRPLA